MPIIRSVTDNGDGETVTVPAEPEPLEVVT